MGSFHRDGLGLGMLTEDLRGAGAFPCFEVESGKVDICETTE